MTEPQPMVAEDLLEAFDRAPPPPRYWISLVLITAAVILDVFDYFVVGYMVSILGPAWRLTYLQSSLMLLGGGVGTIVGALVAGVLADRIGRKWLIVSGVSKNTFRDIEYILESCSGAGSRFEIECYDIGHLYTAAHFLEMGVLKPPLLIQSVFGLLGGIGAHAEDVMHMRRTADRLFGDDYYWSVLGAGRNQVPIATMAASMGGNVRVGLEDSLWDGPGELARTNADQVRRIVSILRGLSLEPASPDEAREMLQLKGRNAVGF